MTQEDYQSVMESASQSLVSIAPSLPTESMVQNVIEQTKDAAVRGYLLPDEDELVRSLFAKYLSTRAALMLTLNELKPLVRGDLYRDNLKRPELFVIAYCIASLLIRSGRYVVDTFRTNPVIWEKLDEAEPRYGIPRKQFTRIFRSLVSPNNIWNYLNATRCWRIHREELQKLRDNPILAPVLDILNEEEEFIESSTSYYAMGHLRYRVHSFFRRHRSGFKNVTFSIFKVSGSVIAEMRMKWKRKRVTRGVRRKIGRLLQPGDVIITRHDDAASNLFLPGFWPHSALHIGLVDERRQIGVEMSDERWNASSGIIRVLEARKDGVLFRELDDTLDVDAFVVIRPKLEPADIKASLTRAITHEGKSYDFEFDFRRSDRLVCTEVIYRAFHGIGSIAFELTKRAGRVCLSAEDLLDHAIDEQVFEVIAVYGANGNRFVTGERAKSVLIASYKNV